jgi:hypothetical protein
MKTFLFLCVTALIAGALLAFGVPPLPALAVALTTAALTFLVLGFAKEAFLNILTCGQHEEEKKGRSWLRPSAAAAIALPLALGACATPTVSNGGNPALQAVFTAESDYDAFVLTPASIYWRLPACPQPSGVICSDPAVVVKLKQADKAVATAFSVAETIARNSPNTDPLTLLADATTAETAIEQILALYGVKWGHS